MQERCRYCDRLLDADDPEHKRFWPFCCERCKMAELGAWFEDRYIIRWQADDVADDAATTDRILPDDGGEHNSS